MKAVLKVFLALALFVVFAPSVVLAENFEKEKKSVSIEVGDDLYSAGDSVSLSADAPDDAFLAGAIVNLTKKVAHDFFAAGSSITILGEVGDDLRAAGSVITLASPIGGDAVVAGGVLNFTENASIGGDAVLAGGMLEFAGSVGGDLQLVGDEINFGGTVGGDTTIRVGENINFIEGAKIAGKLTYFAKKEIAIPAGLAASVEYKDYKEFDKITKENLFSRVLGEFFLLLIGFVTGAVLLVMLGSASEVFTSNIREKFWWSLLAGVLALFVPLIVLLLVVTMAGTWLGLILLFMWIVGLLAAGGLIGFAIGSLFLNQKNQTKYSYKLIALALGWLVFIAIGFIPGFGGIFQLTIFTLALGAGVLTDLDLYKKMKKAKLL